MQPVWVTTASIFRLVNSFTSNPSGTGTLSGGAQTVLVGATLEMSAGQATGQYQSVVPFEVIIIYN